MGQHAWRIVSTRSESGGRKCGSLWSKNLPELGSLNPPKSALGSNKSYNGGVELEISWTIVKILF